MTTPPTECGYTFVNYKCHDYPQAGKDHCILHETDKKKNKDAFEQALKKRLKANYDATKSEIDLRGIVFPEEQGFVEDNFSKPTYFSGAQFCGGAVFLKVKFSKKTDFDEVQFGESTWFIDTEFCETVTFSRVKIQKSLEFRNKTFPKQNPDHAVLFRSISRESSNRIAFERVNLSVVTFLGTDIRETRFVGCRWAKMPVPSFLPIQISKFQQKRIAIHEEVVLASYEFAKRKEFPVTHQEVAETYRQLRLNYESNRQEAEAGDFYIGQMEMRRRDPSYPKHRRWVILPLYRVLAMYGESYLRPVFFYFTLGLLFALLYLWGGFQVGEAQVKYSPGFDLGNFVPFAEDFVRAYVQALTAGGIGILGGQFATNLDNAAWWVSPVRYANMLMDTFLVGFFVIALRRHFRR